MSVPDRLMCDSFNTLLNHIDSLAVCAGHPDDNYVSMVATKKGVLKSRDGKVLDDYAPVMLDGCYHKQTVQHSTCEVLIQNGAKCASCKNYRAVLRKIYSLLSCRQSSVIRQATRMTGT